MRYWLGLAHEQFPPEDLLQQAREGERAGFEGIACSDHLQPWWEPGESGQAWVWLGAAGQATQKIALGTAVTPPGPRYHPVLIAQAWATLERLFPGRPFLGIGSGESLNESPLAAIWPSVPEQVERMEEGLEIISRLFDGERLSYDGRHFETDEATLHTRPNRRPPIYVSAFGPKAAGVAARWGDGLWTLADPETAPDVIDAYRSACEDAGKEPGEIVVQAQFSWAEDDDAALEGARVWKGAQPEEFYTEDWHDPRKMYEEGERQIDDDDLKQALIISSDPEVHIERIREAERLGATTMALMNCSGADPHGAIEVYGGKVLSALAKAPAR
ncbi:MAG TPA: TIGR03557 family F420-dependent LLM class oxidoreductase [Solirubrobacterales bacterium]|nr:TIGR03557 family F420-dependent LLM class oxidoreductase [Solirubrobacterales bacterium]